MPMRVPSPRLLTTDFHLPPQHRQPSGHAVALVRILRQARDHPQGRVETVEVVAVRERGRELCLENAMRLDVGQRAFEAVPDFEARGACVHENEQDGTVVETLAAEARAVRGPDREIVDRTGARSVT
jgi:hypothetical protein